MCLDDSEEKVLFLGLGQVSKHKVHFPFICFIFRDIFSSQKIAYPDFIHCHYSDKDVFRVYNTFDLPQNPQCWVAEKCDN